MKLPNHQFAQSSPKWSLAGYTFLLRSLPRGIFSNKKELRRRPALEDLPETWRLSNPKERD